MYLYNNYYAAKLASLLCMDNGESACYIHVHVIYMYMYMYILLTTVYKWCTLYMYSVYVFSMLALIRELDPSPCLSLSLCGTVRKTL